MASDTPRDDMEDEDDFELEVEPVDPEVLAYERQRTSERTAKAMAGVDVDELVRKGTYENLDVDFSNLRKFRFTTRHLLILTGLFSIVLTFFRLMDNACTATFVLGLIALGAGWMWVRREEREQERRRQERRKELLAGGFGRGDVEFDQLEEKAPTAAFSFKFQFSMKQVLIAFAAASVLFTLLTFLAPEELAVLLGMIALLGLAIHAAGFDPHPMIVLGWWILLVLYILMGLLSTVWPEDEDLGTALPSGPPSYAVVEVVADEGSSLASTQSFPRVRTPA